MRAELNDIEKIERYLRNEMSKEERISFEKEMQNNPDLRKSVEEQKELLKGMERMKMKNDISKGKFKYRLQKGLVNVGIPVLITAAVMALILNWSSSKPDVSTSSTTGSVESKVNYELPELNESGDSLWADADKYIPYQIYSIDTKKDTVITGKEGMVVAIPANSFVDENGNAVKGKIDFELKEALNTETILKGGLSTTSNGELLETGGMFYINARQDGKSLKIAEGKNIYADVPSDPTKTGIILFDGVRMADGNINWVNPKPIEKPLVPVDIHTLNFYPPLYEDSLAKMGKDVTNKKYKDSLYYSFAGRFGNKPTLGLNKDKKYEVELTPSNEKEINVGRFPEDLKSFDLLNSYINERKKLGFVEVGRIDKIEKDHQLLLVCLTKGRYVELFFMHKGIGSNFIYYQEDFDLYFINEKLCMNYSQSQGGYYSKGSTHSHLLLNARKNSTEDFTITGNIDFETKFSQTSKINTKYSIPYNFKIPGTNNPYSCFDTKSDNLNLYSGLNPAKVKSIWNDKFQNTLIATKEFEERMPYIHKLCSRGNNVLDMYVKNIDKKICTIDSMVANTLSGADKEQFLKFAARGEGRVKSEDNCLKKLGNFYDEQTKIYTEAAKKTSEEYYKKNQEKNNEASKKVSEQNTKDANRIYDNFKKELDINMKNAYKQIGKTATTRLSVGTTGWKNLDRYVIEATVTRTTMNYTDPITGKKAVLKYEPLEIKINGVEKYDRILVYLVPDQLNSFMRMKQEGNLFTEKLNMLFKHELVILAYKGDESYFKYYDEILPGTRDSITLEKMSQSDINIKLRSLNKMQTASEVKKDIAYQFFLQADAKRRKVFLEKEKFIRRIERVIFPCGIDVWKTKDMTELDYAAPVSN